MANEDILFSDNSQKHTIGSQWYVVDDPHPASCTLIKQISSTTELVAASS